MTKDGTVYADGGNADTALMGPASEEELVWLGPWRFERLYGWWWRPWRRGSEIGQRWVSI